MSTFSDSETSWSAWTKALEGFTGDPGSPLIVQSPTVLRPIDVRPKVDSNLAWYRKYLVSDTIPFYGNKNPQAYGGGQAKTVSLGYQQYLGELNREVIKRFVNPTDLPTINAALQQYTSAQTALTIFLRNSSADWRKQHAADPTLTRAEWEQLYPPMGYRPQLNLLAGDVSRMYGKYKALSEPYPQVQRIAKALARMDTGSGTQIPLPTSEDEVNLGSAAWDSFYKTNIDLGEDWATFFGTDVPDTRGINQSSQQSSYYNHSWSAGGSVSYGFFNVSGGANGGTVENHLRTDSTAVRFLFKRLVLGTVTRGTWYDAGLVTSYPYYTWVDPASYWGPSGTLNLIPVSLVVGRVDKIEIDTSQRAFDSYRSWRQSSGSLGFSIGPFSIGGGASSSTQWGSTNDTSTGTTIRIEDKSGQGYIFAVVLSKMDQIAPSTFFGDFMRIAEQDYEQFAAEELRADAKKE